MRPLDVNANYKNNTPEIISRIRDFYWETIGWRLKYFYLSVKNLIRWFPIICEDRDWDDHFIWEILKFKLKNQAKYIGARNYHVNAEYDAQRMMLCVRLIDKIQEEYYSSEYMDYHESAYSWIKMDDNRYQLDIQEISEQYDLYLNKHKNTVRKIVNNKELQRVNLSGEHGIRYKRKLAMNVAHYNEKRAQDLLFQILNRDIRKWWD